MDDKTRPSSSSRCSERLCVCEDGLPVREMRPLPIPHGFCRNCLSKWYMAAAKDHGIDMNYDQAREIVYGMTYDEWKDKHQAPASEEQKRLFEETKPLHAEISGHK